MKGYQKVILAAGASAAACAAAGAAISVSAVKKTLGRDTDAPFSMPVGAWAEYAPLLKERSEALMEQFPPEQVKITSTDGLTLQGKLFTPPDADKLALCVHGYHSSGLRDFGGIAWYYIQHGWRVLMVDDRGHGDSDGNVVGFGTLDRHDVLQWLRYCSIRFGQNYPVILHGVSMGAATVMMASGLELPENVKGIVADCGFTSAWEEFDFVMRPRYGSFSPLGLRIADAWARRNAGYGLRECNARDELAHATVPVLFIHGSQDEFVPSWMTDQNYDACPTFKMKYICPGAGHAESWFRDSETYSAKLDEFFEIVMEE